MKKLIAAVIVAGCAAAGLVSPVSAETLDVATLKCSDLADAKPEDIGVMLAWIDGYLGGRADDTRFDIERFSANADAAAKACEDDPNAGLLSIIKDAESE